MNVAGTQGAVKDDRGEPLANVAIGGGAACLWLGFAKPGPAADTSSCVQWIEGDCLPEGYEGDMDDDGDGFLGRSLDVTASEIEIWHIQQVGEAGTQHTHGCAVLYGTFTHLSLVYVDVCVNRCKAAERAGLWQPAT